MVIYELFYFISTKYALKMHKHPDTKTGFAESRHQHKVEKDSEIMKKYSTIEHYTSDTDQTQF